MAPSSPRVTVGLAVYNGENFLTEAVDSILAQTFDDFELIISDNASTDRTEAISREFAGKDPRVRFIRHSHNRGAAWNQSEVMRQARGELFKLAAHDDLIEPLFLEKCVAALDQHPECVLAYADAYQMPRGDRSYLFRWDDPIETSSPYPNERFAQLIRGDLHGFRIFGVIRTAVLLTTPLFGAYHAADHVLVAQLGLLGPFCRVKENLQLIRLHPDQSIQLSTDPKKYVSWWGGKNTRFAFPTWKYSAELIKSVLRAPLPWRERRRCLLHIVRWLKWKRALLATEVFKLRPQTPCWDRPDQLGAKGEAKT